MSPRASHSLGLLLYVAAMLGGMVLHLLAHASREDRQACQGTPGPRGGDPHGDDGHTHLEHPDHEHEDGCGTCPSFTSQSCEATPPPARDDVAREIAPPRASRVVPAPAPDPHPGRAPPAA